MKVIKCLIQDEELLSAADLWHYLQQLPGFEACAGRWNASDALQFLKDEQLEIVFLDIREPHGSVSSPGGNRRYPAQVLVTPASNESVNLKRDKNLSNLFWDASGLSRFIAAYHSNSHDAGTVPAPMESRNPGYLMISSMKKKKRILFSDILFIESKREYISIVTPGKTYLTKQTLSDTVMSLPPGMFIRVHRSFVLAKDKIDECSATSAVIGDHNIPISRFYRESTRKALPDFFN
ncbi:MAG: LytTR family transcriptional regulator DNA-binding domain-containing protein [Ferruginibacter sp.]